MGQRANPALIGGFVLLALALVVAVVLYLGAGRFGGDWVALEMYFRSDVSGLQVGDPVVLKGVPIGRVTEIRVQYRRETSQVLVPVRVLINTQAVSWPSPRPPNIADLAFLRELIERGLRARLTLQSLVTGRLMVELGFHPDTPAHFALPAGERGREIPTVASSFDELKQNLTQLPLDDLARSLLRAADGFQRLVDAPETMRLIRDAGATLRGVDTLAGTLNAQVAATGEELQSTLHDYRELARKVQGETLVLSASLRDASEEAGRLAKDLDGQVKPLAADLNRVAGGAVAALDAARRAFAEAAQLLGRDSTERTELRTALRQIAAAARAVRELADFLERHPESLLRGKH